MCIQVKCNKIDDGYRDSLMLKIEASHSMLVNAVERFNKKEAKKPISRDDLETFPLGVWVSVNEKIRVRKRKNRFSTFLNFDTEMIKGAEFGEHFHDDIVESTEVIKGKLLDTFDGKFYEVGDVAHYEKGVKHTPIAVEDTMLHVLFK